MIMPLCRPWAEYVRNKGLSIQKERVKLYLPKRYCSKRRNPLRKPVAIPVPCSVHRRAELILDKFYLL